MFNQPASVRLSSGADMPAMGYGTWQLPKSTTAHLVKEAIHAGFRHIDCAADYGNETEVGVGINDALTARWEPNVMREDLWITSKLWNTCHRREAVRPACEATLRALGVDYLDLYLIHHPIAFAPSSKIGDTPKRPDGSIVFDDVPLRETWEAMQELVDAGLVRNIGVSSMSSQLLLDLLSYARIPPVVNQIEAHPYLNQQRLIDFCRMKGIHVTAFAPLGSSPEDVAAARGEYTTLSVLDRDEVKTVAHKHGMSAAAVVLRWGLQRGCSVIPKTKKIARLSENLESFSPTKSFQLTEEDMALIDGLNCNVRYYDPLSMYGLDIFA